MPKQIAKLWKVMVDDNDLSNFADNVDTPQTKDQVDVSGFGGTREFLPGVRDDTITIQFFAGFGSGEPNSVLQPLFDSGSAFPIFVQPDSSAGTSGSNPLFGGSANIYEYNGGAAALNEAQKFSATFKPCTGSEFTWGTVAP